MGIEGRRPSPPAADATELRARVADTVRELRTRAGESLADLAARAGIGKSTLHAIESGDANPSIETLWALANALSVPFGELLEPPSPEVRVVRAGEAPEVASERSELRAHLLTTTTRGGRTELYTLDVEPGTERDAVGHIGGSVEHVLLIRGRLRVGPARHPVVLEPGDLVAFAGDAAHVYGALEPDTFALLLMEYP
jgi:transcriptional regulator with XRE-family HTH domain